MFSYIPFIVISGLSFSVSSVCHLVIEPSEGLVTGATYLTPVEYFAVYAITWVLTVHNSFIKEASFIHFNNCHITQLSQMVLRGNTR